jgi:thioesterase domain-containing protein
MLARIQKDFGKKLEMASLFEAPTIEEFSRTVRQTAPARHRVSTMEAGGQGARFFCVHAHPLFRQLAQQVARSHPFLTLVPPAVADLPGAFTLENIAAHHVRSIRDIQPVGPYYLGGWCRDGVIAYEVARQLRGSGGEVGGVVMFDSRNPRTRGLPSDRGGRPSVCARLRYHLKRMCGIPSREWRRYLAERWGTICVNTRRKAWRIGYGLKLLNDRRVSSFVRDIEPILAMAVSSYAPATYPGAVTLIRPEDRARSLHEDTGSGWRSVAADLDIREVPGNHRTMFLPPNVRILASILCEMMDGEMPSAAIPDSFRAQPAQAKHAGR